MKFSFTKKKILIISIVIIIIALAITLPLVLTKSSSSSSGSASGSGSASVSSNSSGTSASVSSNSSGASSSASNSSSSGSGSSSNSVTPNATIFTSLSPSLPPVDVSNITYTLNKDSNNMPVSVNLTWDINSTNFSCQIFHNNSYQGTVNNDNKFTAPIINGQTNIYTIKTLNDNGTGYSNGTSITINALSDVGNLKSIVSDVQTTRGRLQCSIKLTWDAPVFFGTNIIYKVYLVSTSGNKLLSTSPTNSFDTINTGNTFFIGDNYIFIVTTTSISNGKEFTSDGATIVVNT